MTPGVTYRAVSLRPEKRGEGSVVSLRAVSATHVETSYVVVRRNFPSLAVVIFVIYECV